MGFSATHHSSSACHFKRNAKKNNTHSEATKTKWYRLYPSLTQIEMTMHAPALVQQFTYLVHPNRSHRLSYLLRKNADMTGKIQQERDKHKKNEQTVHATRHSSFQKRNDFTFDLPRSNCLLCSVDHAVVPCCCHFFVGLANSSREAACFEVASLLLSTPTSGWNRIHSCLGLVQFKRKNHPHWLEEGPFFSSPSASHLAILRVHLIPYRSQANVAAFQVPPTLYRPRVTL